MKTRFLLIALCACCNIVSAQYCGNSGSWICTPMGQQATAGFSPSFFVQNPLINGLETNLTLQFQSYDTASFAGTTVTIDSLQIDTIDNLPAGLCWSTNKTTNRFANQEEGCIVISGTPCAPPGQYQLYIVWDIWIAGIGELTLNASQEGVYYFLRLANPGESIPVIDTANESNNTLGTYTPYGPSADCQIGPPAVSLGGNKTVCNGSVFILDPQINGGLPPYTYSWQGTGSALSCYTCSNPTVTVTQNSTYIVAITDANSNVAVDTVVYTISANTNSIQLTTANTNINCTNPEDTTTVTAANGIWPFTINWGDGNQQYDSGTLSASHEYGSAGVYVISLTDSQGCASSLFDTVADNGIVITLNQAIQPTCYTTTNGQLSVNVTGGTAPYSYSWNTGAVTTGLSSVQAGYYTLTVTDVTSCSATFSYVLNSISDPWGYYVFLNETDANCSNNGSVTSNIYGGLPPYSYLWNNSSTTANITGLGSGTYNITVTDSAGCSATGGIYVNSSCTSIISGLAFYDNNNNCTFGAGDSGVAGFYVQAQSSTGDIFYGSTDSSGNYTIAVTDTGTFYLQAIEYYGYACVNITFCGNPGQTVYLPLLGDTSANNNIAFATGSGFDLTLHPGWTSANPGFTKEYWVMPYNQSPVPFTGTATVVFNFDSNLIYQYSDTPLPVVDLAAHTLTWQVTNVPSPYFDWSARFQNFFIVPSSLPLGYLLQSSFSIMPTSGDCDTSNNFFTFSETCVGSHDPNEKIVSPAGPITANDSVLTYTIYFQNTGTDSTHFVVVKDTLSSNLDPSTVRNVASSDKYSSFTITGKGILTWTFNPLRIVDSSTNPSGSKRFIMFTVKTKGNLPVGTAISNTASVYFDYNTPVVTNTVADTMTTTNIWEIAGNNGISVKAYPNPFSDVTNFVVTGLNERYSFELYDVTGRLTQNIPSLTSNQFQIERGGLSNGIYLYRIIAGNKQVAYGKLVIQ